MLEEEWSRLVYWPTSGTRLPAVHVCVCVILCLSVLLGDERQISICHFLQASNTERGRQ